MRKTVILSALATATAVLAASPAHAGACPSLGADTDCGFLITINSNGTITAGPVSGQGPYDGIEDTLVGVVNNSGVALPSLTLSGSNIFGFDGDGQQSYTHVNNGPTGYEGPNTSFTVVDNSNGTVNFGNGGVAANGGTAWFTLEENLASITGGVVVTTGVPEPGTWGMMLLGFGAVGVALRRRRKTAPVFA